MKITKMENYRQFMGRLAPGQDLYAAINNLCKDMSISIGHVQGIGAVRNAVIGYFDPVKGEYKENRFDQQMEIVSFNGNISLKDGVPVVHAHIALGDPEGRVFGGHLLPGTEIFVFEYVITTGDGVLKRVMDSQLKLSLWES